MSPLEKQVLFAVLILTILMVIMTYWVYTDTISAYEPVEYYHNILQ
jgi:hypothetical protein